MSGMTIGAAAGEGAARAVSVAPRAAVIAKSVELRIVRTGGLRSRTGLVPPIVTRELAEWG